MSKELEELVKQINDSFLVNDMEKFLSFCSDELTWTMAGESKQSGKENIRKWMVGMEGCEPPKFDVERMFSNDESVTCYGQMTMKGESGADESYSFCDVYLFADGKVADLQSFVIKNKKSEA